MKTGNELVAYAKNRIGTPYFYGAKIPEGALTENKMSTMHRMYPRVVTTYYMAKARRKGQVGKVNVDCSGLIAGYRQLNIGSYQLYQTAYTRMPIAKINDCSWNCLVEVWPCGCLYRKSKRCPHVHRSQGHQLRNGADQSILYQVGVRSDLQGHDIFL